MSQDGRRWLFEEGMTCLLDERELADPLFMENLVQGKISTGKLYPILTEKRIDHVKGLLSNHKVEDEISDEDIQIAIRDLFVAVSRNILLTNEERTQFMRAVDLMEAAPIGTLLGGGGGLRFSSCPSKCFKKLRWVSEQELAKEVDAASLQKFLHSSQGFVAVFVDGREMSYHCFENILPLDNCIGKEELVYTMHSEHKSQNGVQVALLSGDTQVLEEIGSATELYVEPNNWNARGGKRYIFHSARLSQGLTSAVQELIGDDASFSHVNPVFRMNQFAPDDAPFTFHLDTPYYDRARSLVSKRTLLIYLTGGSADSVLTILHPDDDRELVSFQEIQPMTCILMDQSFPHEGKAYSSGVKIFLRTELVYKVHSNDLARDTQSAQLFSSACYLEAESAFHSSLVKEAEERYQLANQLRWQRDTSSKGPSNSVRLVKATKDTAFVSDGFNYWFRSNLDVRICALLAVCDYLNILVCDGWGNRRPFRDIVGSVVVKNGKTPLELLASAKGVKNKAKRIDAVIVENETQIGEKMKVVLGIPTGFVDDHCCPFHVNNFCPLKCGDCVAELERCKTALLPMLKNPVLALGSEVLLDPSLVIARDDKIYVGTDRELDPVSFAACWNCDVRPKHFVTAGSRLPVAKLLCPPIPFTQSEDSGTHLIFDFFRNDWSLQTVDVSIQCGVVLPKMAMGGNGRAYVLAEDCRIRGTHYRKVLNPEYDSDASSGF